MKPLTQIKSPYLLSAYAAGRRDFRGVQIVTGFNQGFADIFDAEMPGINLMGSDLHSIRFAGGSLRGANLRRVALPTEMLAMDLRGVDFRGAIRHGDTRNHFAGSDLRGADFRGAELQNSIFWGDRAKIRQVWKWDSTIEPSADLRGADLRGALFERWRARDRGTLRTIFAMAPWLASQGWGPLGHMRDPGPVGDVRIMPPAPARTDGMIVDRGGAHWLLANAVSIDLKGLVIRDKRE